MNKKNRIEIDSELLDKINGGSLGFDPDKNGTFTMKCGFSGQVFPGVSLAQVMQISQYCATVPNTAEGEQQIIAWAQSQGII